MQGGEEVIDATYTISVLDDDSVVLIDHTDGSHDTSSHENLAEACEDIRRRYLDEEKENE